MSLGKKRSVVHARIGMWYTASKRSGGWRHMNIMCVCVCTGARKYVRAWWQSSEGGQREQRAREGSSRERATRGRAKGRCVKCGVWESRQGEKGVRRGAVLEQKYFVGYETMQHVPGTRTTKVIVSDHSLTRPTESERCGQRRLCG